MRDIRQAIIYFFGSLTGAWIMLMLAFLLSGVMVAFLSWEPVSVPWLGASRFCLVIALVVASAMTVHRGLGE